MTAPPHFSIVVPTYNRPAALRRLLHHISRLDFDHSLFEVIIVDDGSTPAVDALYGVPETITYRLIRQSNKGPAAARNRGAACGTGQFLAFTDDDCFPQSQWLNELYGALHKCPSALCGGRTVNWRKSNPYAETTQLVADYIYEHYNPTKRRDGFFPTNNLGVPREAFLEMGGFDQGLRYGEDRDFCYRWASNGKIFIDVPRSIVYHDHNLTMGSFLRLHFSYGRGTCLFRIGCNKKGLSSVPLSSAAWYLALILSGYHKHRGLKGCFLSLLLAACQIATAAGIFHEFFGNADGPRF